ncbi:hypothetical protein BASA83_001190 [Batrachochytrium salamandrivorans]|nr:hypothetical protein BASA83_001190 [Batrachochytrium salamandrivorans]
MSVKVYQAETGVLLPLRRLLPGDTLDVLRADIEAVSSVPVQAQILLTSNSLSAKQSMVPDWIASQNDEVLFLFNRLALDPKGGEMHVHMSIDIEPPVPTDAVVGIKIKSPLESHMSIEECQESFINAFGEHISYGQALLKIANKHAATCDRLMEEQLVQLEALKVAMKNLGIHRRGAIDSFDNFIGSAQRQCLKHSELLHNIPMDLQTLNQIPIHGAVTTEYKHLDDYIPKTKLYVWIDSCKIEHEDLVNSTQRFSSTINDIRDGIRFDSLEPDDLSKLMAKLDLLLGNVKKMASQMEARQQILERDFTRVETILADISNGPSSQVNERFEALEHLYDIHLNEYIPEITRYDRQIRETVVFFSDSKAHSTHVLKTKLLEVSNQQSLIASVPQTISTLTAALKAQADAFVQIQHVHRMAPAWGAALIEVVRRKEHTKVFVVKAKEMLDILTRFRIQEERRRETFNTEIIRYIPRNLLQGLDEKPPMCILSISGAEGSLPNLTRDDISAFSQLVSSIRATQDPPSIQASDSISKLQATMVRMAPQIDAIPLDFEKLAAKSSFCGQIAKLEAQNANLVAAITELRVSGDPASHTSTPTRHPSFSDTTSTSHFTKQEEKIKAYEERIKSLESLLQKNYASGGLTGPGHTVDWKAVKAMEAQLENMSAEQVMLTEKCRSLQGQLDQAGQENTKLSVLYKNLCETAEKTLAEKQEVEAQIDSLENKHNKMQSFLGEMREHLEGCSQTLRRDTPLEADKGREEQTPVQEHHWKTQPTTMDGLRRCMRELRDDVLWHAATLESMKNSMHDSQDDSDCTQSVAGEIVTLIQRLGEVEERHRIAESDLTVAQAHEAVLEAELESLRVLYERAEGHVGTAKQQRKEQQEQHASDLQCLRDKLKQQVEQYEAAVASINHLRLELAAAQLELRQIQGQVVEAGETQREHHRQAVDGLHTQIQRQSQRHIAELAAEVVRREASSVACSQVRQMRDQIENWNIVCSLGLKHATVCMDALVQLVRYILPDGKAELLVDSNDGGVHGRQCNGLLAPYNPTSNYREQPPSAKTNSDCDDLAAIPQFVQHYDSILKEMHARVASAGAFMDVDNSLHKIEQKWQELSYRAENRVAFQDFKINDLALFLPARNQIAWSAFNVDTPNYFLDHQSSTMFVEKNPTARLDSSLYHRHCQ